MVVTTGEQAKLRILCLHGYEQDSSIFRTKLRQHIAGLADVAEFELVFVDAPNVLQPYDIDGMDNLKRAAAVRSGESLDRTIRGWYWLKSAAPEQVCGLETSVEFLASVLRDNGPFDGVLGFSQGGLMAAVLCAMLENRDSALDSGHPELKFAIIASGYKLDDSRWTYLYEQPLRTPSLHMYGVLDTMIHVSKSIDLRRAFAHSVELSTLGAHFVPKSPMAVATMRDFVAQYR